MSSRPFDIHDTPFGNLPLFSLAQLPQHPMPTLLLAVSLWP
jgi:hypothetical protein